VSNGGGAVLWRWRGTSRKRNAAAMVATSKPAATHGSVTMP
jgi:hypothetical protein